MKQELLFIRWGMFLSSVIHSDFHAACYSIWSILVNQEIKELSWFEWTEQTTWGEFSAAPLTNWFYPVLKYLILYIILDKKWVGCIDLCQRLHTPPIPSLASKTALHKPRVEGALPGSSTACLSLLGIRNHFLPPLPSDQNKTESLSEVGFKLTLPEEIATWTQPLGTLSHPDLLDLWHISWLRCRCFFYGVALP